MRHPNIITYLDSIEVGFRNLMTSHERIFQLEGTFYLVTEKCKPLELYLKEAGLTESQKEFVVSWGMFQLLVCFLIVVNLQIIYFCSERSKIYARS